MNREWTTRQVRAWNLKPGDVIGFLDRKRMKEVRRTVDHVEPSLEFPGDIEVHFRRWRWAMHLKRNMLMRIRRLDGKK